MPCTAGSVGCGKSLCQGARPVDVGGYTLGRGGEQEEGGGGGEGEEEGKREGEGEEEERTTFKYSS